MNEDLAQNRTGDNQPAVPRDVTPQAGLPAGAPADPTSPMRSGALEMAADSTGESYELPKRVYSPWRSSWRTFRRHRTAMAGLVILVLLYLMVIFAGFIAPYHYDTRATDLMWTPPTSLHFSDENTGFSFRPFIYPTRSYLDENLAVRFEEDRTQRCYVRFFVTGDEYSVFGLFQSNTHLFGVDPAAPPSGAQADQYLTRIYLLGADVAGRDTFSRICYGSRISMTIGLLGTALVLLIGLAIGGTSGYFGGRIDNILQRFTEMVMLLPGFYLLLMLRFMFPSNMDSTTVYFAVVLILALIGWPGLSRVIRGMVLSIRAMDYVQAARAVGVPTRRIIGRHVIPNTFGYVIVSATLSIPSYILSESALSILGLGIMEPTPSWGNMLQKAMDIAKLNEHPWVLWPGLFIFLAVMAFNLVGDGLRDALDPRRLKV
jgi:peptide/nickel transport system permease protein